MSIPRAVAAAVLAFLVLQILAVSGREWADARGRSGIGSVGRV
jgi:hypothetical protein